MQGLRQLAVIAVIGVPVLAQHGPPPEEIEQRLRDGKELIELSWRRDAHGMLEVALPGFRNGNHEPLFTVSGMVTGGMAATGFAAFAGILLLGDDLLAMTDGERHLQRAGIVTASADLRQFLLTPAPAGDAMRARVDLLDKLVAIDLLRRANHKGAAAELTVLARSKDAPAMLRGRAAEALAVLTTGRAALARRRFAVETLPLPVTADGYLVVDHALLPDMAHFMEVVHDAGVANCRRLVTVLKAPTWDDLYFTHVGVARSGEMAFELVRRFGNVRFDQTVAAFVAQPTGAMPFGWCVQTVGEFELTPLLTEIEGAVAGEAEVKLERKDGALAMAWPGGELQLASTAASSSSKGMRGRPQPALAKELLAAGPAVRVVLPPTSKAWLGLAFLKLPPAGRAELGLYFGDEVRLEIALQARDEDAAEAWVARGKELQAEALPQLQAMLTKAGEVPPELQPLLTALGAANLAANGRTVAATLTSRDLGWATLRTLLRLQR